jgi:putative tricarboxylic transport membrane protein
MSSERVEVPPAPAPPPPGGAAADGADAAASGDESPSVVSTRTVEIVVAILLLGFAGLMGFDNWRTGMGWAPDGPKAGYFPFYLSVIVACASLYWLAEAALRQRRSAPPKNFVNREQLGRVLRVFLPTVLFCVATQFLGLYVASFLLIVGFMRWVGRIAWWKCLVTSVAFSIAMFVVFDLAFDVIMPKGPLEALFGR